MAAAMEDEDGVSAGLDFHQYGRVVYKDELIPDPRWLWEMRSMPTTN